MAFCYGRLSRWIQEEWFSKQGVLLGGVGNARGELALGEPLWAKQHSPHPAPQFVPASLLSSTINSRVLWTGIIIPLDRSVAANSLWWGIADKIESGLQIFSPLPQNFQRDSTHGLSWVPPTFTLKSRRPFSWYSYILDHRHMLVYRHMFVYTLCIGIHQKVRKHSKE